MKGSGFPVGIIIGFLIALGLLYLYHYGYLSGILGNVSALLQHNQSTIGGTTIPTNYMNQTTNSSQLSLDEYALSLINQARKSYGLTNVTLSMEQSGVQHSDNMLAYGYLSHWDIYGMKPYMRYTLLGGRGAVDENVGYVSNESCGLLGCRGTINVRNAVKNIINSMLNNDSQCCNNGHRYNILDPNHNQISIGIGYNSSTVYMTQDFIDNYTTWNTNSPSYYNGQVSLSGSLQNGYSISQVIVSYDQPVQNMSVAQLKSTFSYSYGQQVAGVVSNPLAYYPNITTIDADRYSINGQSFDIAFNMQNVVKQYGAGEYTVMLWLSNGGSGQNSTFVGSTYTVFINGSLQAYAPKNV